MSQELNVVDLMDLEIPSDTVQVGQAVLVVYGLPYHEMMEAFKGATDVLASILDGAEGVIDSIINHNPDLVCKIIMKALGHDSAQALAKIKRLPVQAQGEILIKTFKLSFPDEELLGKLLAQVHSAMVVIGRKWQRCR